ncbi:glutamate-rich protein 3 [Kryptolebias marmoratus]|uniref:glutamate-rich protein 3 n=1 Tax=Kryptolebias marmoratus TaxID=37003 RepID=UPI0018ACD29E|nr:glutamate-rich protein 3 [Kryptolebias marmoratus]
MEPMRRIRRNSRTLLQDLVYRGDTPIPAQPRDAKMIQTVASLIRAKSKLLLLENPDTVEIYKLQEPAAGPNRPGKGDIYLPAIPKKSSGLNSVPRSLSQSCPYLYNKRRGSFSSVTSQRTRGHTEKQNNLKVQKEAKKSNITVTMTYLGQGLWGSGLKSTQDELKVLQQMNGGENICVFKGLVNPGEQFQFVSQRHRGFPFSATFYINGLMVTRISSCCEYRYAPGFQQGRKSCFRLTWLAGGMPCYRCTSLRNKYSSCQQLNNDTKENLILPLEQNTGNDNIKSSSPLFIPAKPEKKSVRRTRKHIKEGGSTDSEDLVVGMKETSRKKRRRGQINQKESKGKTAGNNRGGEHRRDDKGSERSTVTEKSEGRPKKQQKHLKTANSAAEPQTEKLPSNKTQKSLISLQDEDVLTKQNMDKQKDLESDGRSRDVEKPKDFYKECVEMSAELNRCPNKHWFKANILERCRLQKRLLSCPKDQGSDVELSAESDTMPQPEDEEDATCQNPGEEEPVEEQDLQAQLDAMMTVLKTSDEVEQLVLRNTDLTDDLLLSLAGVLKSSPSEVTLLNLNLNLIGPFGAHILLDVLKVKLLVKGLHLFGNKLRDHGVLTLLTGIAELQEQTAQAAIAIHQALLFPSEQNLMLQLTPGWSSFRVFALLELDIGGNSLSSDGVKVLASFMRSHSHLQYLGLAQTSGADLAAWKELFDSLKGNSSLTQIILDENNLGDPGVRLLADILKENVSLQQVDLDRNGISDVGGNDIMGALLCRTQFPLRHLSLQENNISAGLMSRIQEEVKPK